MRVIIILLIVFSIIISGDSFSSSIIFLYMFSYIIAKLCQSNNVHNRDVLLSDKVDWSRIYPKYVEKIF